MNEFLKIGHRGCGKGYGENTMLSLELALRAGAQGVEYDVRKTKCGRIVLMHDETLSRTVKNGIGKVSAYTYAEIKSFNAGYGESIPLLSGVLQGFKTCFHNIELKENVGPEVVQLIKRYKLQDQVLVSSFDWDSLAPVAQAGISIALIADAQKIKEMGENGFVRTAVNLGATAINPHFSAVTPSLILLAYMEDTALKIYPWTVDEPNDIAQMKKMGVDGIISNFPERL
jgi:glycerophosphoryl diester phosphodiesterase